MRRRFLFLRTTGISAWQAGDDCAGRARNGSARCPTHPLEGLASPQDSSLGLSRFVASHPCIRVRRVYELFRPLLAIFRAFLAIFRAFLASLHQFESENAASCVDVNPVSICKQTCALPADTPIDHVANDLSAAFDTARRHHGAVGERDLVMKLKELPSRLGIQGDHGSLSVLIPDEHDPIADAQCPKGLPIAQSTLDSIVRRSLPQDLPRTGIDGMNHAVDGLESSMVVEDGESIGTHIGWRIY